MLTQLIQEMKKEELLGDYTEDHVTYELSQLCGQVYLYKGYILQDQYRYQTENRHPYLLMEHDFRGTAERIFHILPTFQQGTDLDKKNSLGMAPVDRVYGRKWWPTYEDWSGFDIWFPCLF